MYKNNSLWYFNPDENIPNDFIIRVKRILNNKTNKDPESDLKFLTQLLWKRNIRTQKDLEHFFNPQYIHDHNSIFTQQINIAIDRLIKANHQGEKIAIWGDYSCDSIITTAILSTGLRDFFTEENQQISYYFPSRNLPQFGLNINDITTLKKEGYSLILCACIGSQNYQEIEFAKSLGIDIIIIENTILSIDHPPVLAWLNPHLLPENHPDYYLSGGAIAYKLIRFFHDKIKSNKKIKYEDLRCLIAVGLMADKYLLKGNNRYFAVSGSQLLENNYNSLSLQFLVTSCHENGDRTLNIERGIGAKIKAICHTYNDVKFLINFLTGNDDSLIEERELEMKQIYYDYLHLKEEILNQAKKQINNDDISQKQLIFLKDNQWDIRIIESTSQFLRNQYGLTTILLSSKLNYCEENESDIYYGVLSSSFHFNIENFVNNCHKLLISYHVIPYGMKFFINKENLYIFQEVINQLISKETEDNKLSNLINIDFQMTVDKLNLSVFRQLKKIQPCSLDNPNARILLRQCQLTFISYPKKLTINNKIKNNNNTQLIKKEIYDSRMSLSIQNNSCDTQIKAIWWGFANHNPEKDKYYDLVAELDYDVITENLYLRIVDLRLSDSNKIYYQKNNSVSILDYRREEKEDKLNNIQGKIIHHCPIKWSEIHSAYQAAIASQDNLILAYNHPSEKELEELWQRFLSMIKGCLKQSKTMKKDNLLKTLSISDISLNKICDGLGLIGINCQREEDEMIFNQIEDTFTRENYLQARENFRDIINQEYLQKEYFYQVKVQQIKEYLHFQQNIQVE